MLLCGAFRQWLEPVGVVRHTILGGPLFHTLCHCIGYIAVETCTIVHHVDHLLIDVLGQVLVHFFTIEDLATKILSWSFHWCFYVERLLLESLTDNLKS